MADVKISALPALTTAALTDLFAVVQGGVTYKGTLTQLVAAIPDATGSTRGLLAAADWTTFNGKIGAIGTINSVAKAANGAVNSSGSLIMQTADGTNPGLVSTGTQTFAGNKTFTGESATVGNALVVQNSTPTAKFTVANAGRVSLTSDTNVTTQTVSVITTDTTNAGLVLRPNGTGAIMAQAPDGTATGGNARGTNAVDLQMVRNAATQVASGIQSVILGGERNVCAGTNSTVAGGASNSAPGSTTSVGGGSGNVASGNFSNVCGGASNSATAVYGSVSGGLEAVAYLNGQRANATGRFAANSDAQTSAITLRRSITGTAQAELFLDGSSARAILALPTGATNARAWRAQIDLVAIVATAGGGGLVINECFMGSYVAGIKRVGTSTSLVGAVGVVNEVSDTNMATAVVTIDADDTNESLRIQFTPPSTADANTVIRVVATAYLTEVGR